MHPFEFDRLKKIRHKQQSEKNKLAAINKKLNRRKKQAEALRKDQIKRQNPNELRFKEILIINNIEFIWQKPFYDIERYICVDFFLPKLNIVIEIDGKFHEETIKYDLKRTIYLKKNHNIKSVVRFTNKEIALNSKNIHEFITMFNSK